MRACSLSLSLTHTNTYTRNPHPNTDPVGAYSQDTRRLRVEISAAYGELFVDAPFVDVDAAGPASGDANRLQGQTYDDAAAQGISGNMYRHTSINIYIYTYIYI